MAVLSLSVSGLAYGASPLDDLVNSSGTIVNQMDLAIKTVAGQAVNASNGYISPTGMAENGKITEAQVTAYNNAIAIMAGSSFYGAEEFLQDQGDAALDQMELAIGDFVDAATEIATILEVSEMASDAQATTEMTDDQKVAEFVETNEVTLALQQETVDEYNQSLDDVEEYAQEAAAYIGLANNTDAVAFFDQGAENNNSSFADEASATFDISNNRILVSWQNTNNGSAVYFDGTDGLAIDLFKSSSQILTDGTSELFYTTGPTALGYECFFNNTNCPE